MDCRTMTATLRLVSTSSSAFAKLFFIHNRCLFRFFLLPCHLSNYSALSFLMAEGTVLYLVTELGNWTRARALRYDVGHPVRHLHELPYSFLNQNLYSAARMAWYGVWEHREGAASWPAICSKGYFILCYGHMYYVGGCG